MKDQFSIAYGFSNCSDRVYRKLFAEKKQFVMVTDQKYHGLLQRGFVKNGAASPSSCRQNERKITL